MKIPGWAVSFETIQLSGASLNGPPSKISGFGSPAGLARKQPDVLAVVPRDQEDLRLLELAQAEDPLPDNDTGNPSTTFFRSVTIEVIGA